jgi:shikimate kinase
LSFVLPTRVFLTGPAGGGKTTVGALLAARLGYVLVDLDREVERRTGRTVAALFAERGEAGFRRAEAAALAEAAVRPRAVVATGGGALLDPPSRALAHAAGPVVYLRATPDTLAARLAGDTTRPLLLDAEGRPLAPDALRARLAALLAERDPSYRLADGIVDTDALTPADVAAAVARWLRQQRG